MTPDSTSRNAPDRMDLPIHPMLMPFPVACFAGAFVTDLVYWQTVAVMWETFSVWLITAGLIVAGFAIIVGVIDFARGKQIRTLTWFRAVGYALALPLSLLNAFIHSRDGYTAVVPTGLMLSGVVVVVLLLTGWLGSISAYRHRVGVAK